MHILTEAESSFEECFELCYHESECERFYYEKIGKGNDVKCILMRAGCEDGNPKMDYHFVTDCNYGLGTLYNLLKSDIETRSIKIKN